MQTPMSSADRFRELRKLGQWDPDAISTKAAEEAGPAVEPINEKSHDSSHSGRWTVIVFSLVLVISAAIWSHSKSQTLSESSGEADKAN